MFARQRKSIHMMLSFLALAVLSLVLPVFQSSAQAYTHVPFRSQDQVQINAVFGAIDTADHRPSAFLPGGSILYRVDVFNNGAPFPTEIGIETTGPNRHRIEDYSQFISLPSNLTRFAIWAKIPTEAPAGVYTISAQLGGITSIEATGSFRVRSLLGLDLTPDKTKNESAPLRSGKVPQETYDVTSCLLDAGSLFFPEGSALKKLYGAYTVVSAVKSEGGVLIKLAQTSDHPMAASEDLIITIGFTFVPCADLIRHNGPIIVHALTEYLKSLTP